MRTRDEIEKDMEEAVNVAGRGHRILEVLLDIREMLDKVVNPLYVVDTDKVDMEFLTGITRTPFGDIVTAAKPTQQEKYCKECGSSQHTTEEH